MKKGGHRVFGWYENALPDLRERLLLAPVVAQGAMTTFSEPMAH